MQSWCHRSAGTEQLVEEKELYSTFSDARATRSVIKDLYTMDIEFEEGFPPFIGCNSLQNKK